MSIDKFRKNEYDSKNVWAKFLKENEEIVKFLKNK
jgi:hypothetical protein